MTMLPTALPATTPSAPPSAPSPSSARPRTRPETEARSGHPDRRDQREPADLREHTSPSDRSDRPGGATPARTERRGRAAGDTASGTTDQAPVVPAAADFQAALESALAGLPTTLPVPASPAATPAPATPVASAPAAATATAPMPTTLPGSASIPPFAVLSGTPAATTLPPQPGLPDAATAPAPTPTSATPPPATALAPAATGTAATAPLPTPADAAAPATTTAAADAPDLASTTAGAADSGATPESGGERQRATLADDGGAPDSTSPAPTVTQVVAQAPSAAPVTAGTTTASRGEHVTRQVFPEITQLTQTATPGTHRLSITLHPEDLGEVKVTLVMRAGSIQVHLAADTPAARAALADGSHDLHRMLELASPADARVVVRDAGTSNGADTRQQGQAGQGQTSLDQGGSGQPGSQQRDARHTEEFGQQAGELFRGPASGASRATPTAAATTEPAPSTASTTTGTGRLDRLM